MTNSTRSYTNTGTESYAESYAPSLGALEIFYIAQNASRWGG